MAGGERVPPAPLGWNYFILLLRTIYTDTVVDLQIMFTFKMVQKKIFSTEVRIAQITFELFGTI